MSHRTQYAGGPLDDMSMRLLGEVDYRLAAITLYAGRQYQLRTGNVIRVTCGRRTSEEQEELVRLGKSKTLKSKHLTGSAVDLAILSPDRLASYWDISRYRGLNIEMQTAAKHFGYEPGVLVWGGSWSTFVDGVHWQLELPLI